MSGQHDLRKSIDLRPTTPPHLSISQALNNLAMVHYRLKQYDVAEPSINENLANEPTALR